MQIALTEKDINQADKPKQNTKNKYIITRYFQSKNEEKEDARYMVLESA